MDDVRIKSRLSSEAQSGDRTLLTVVLGVYFCWSNKQQQQQQFQNASSVCLTHEISARGAAGSSFRRHVGGVLHSPLRTCEFYFHFQTKYDYLGCRKLFQTRFCFDDNLISSLWVQTQS